MATSNLRFRIIGDDDASGAFLKVAAAARLTKATFDDLNSSALGLTKLVGGAGLIPVLAGATAAAAELTTSLAAGAGALGIFGVSVVGIGSDMVKQQKKITELDTKLSGLQRGTDEYRQTLMQLHIAQKTFNQDFGPAANGLDRMKASFSKFKDATRDVTTGVMAKGFNLVASVLPKLVPVSNAAGRAVGGLIDDLSNWTKGAGFKELLHWLETSGPKAITSFGHIVGNVMSGLGGIFKNFVGPGDHAAKTLENLTKRFAAWGHSKGVSDSVNKFLNYVSSNGPTISSALSAMADSLPKLASAAGGLGSLNLNVITAFLNLIAAMPQGVFNVVVDGMFGLVAASKALTIITGINTLITGLQIGMMALGDACIATRIGLTALWVAEKAGAVATGLLTAAQWALNVAMDANPIGLVVIGIAALVAGLIIAYKKSETFRNIVNGAFHGVQVVAAKVFGWLKGAVSATIGFIKGHWQLLLAILGGPIALAAVAVVKNWGRIKSAISNGVSNVIGFVKSHWQLLVGIIAGPLGVAVGLVIRHFGAIKTAVSNAVGTVVNTVRGLPGRIQAAVGNLGSILFNAGSSVIQGLIDGIQSKVGALTSKLHAITSMIPIHKGPIDKDRKLLQPAGEAIMDGLLHGLDKGWIKVRTALEKVTGYISSQRDKLNGLLSTKADFAAGFQSFTSSVFSTDLSHTTQDAAGNDVTTPATIEGILRFQKQQRNRARRLRRDVAMLHRMGLSDALIRQLQASGESGLAQIHTLAGGSVADVRRLNILNAGTQSALHQAGTIAGGQLFNHQIRQRQQNEDLAERIARRLREALQHEKKGEELVIKDVNGQWIIKAIRKEGRTKGPQAARTS